jgi:glycosyltransferase involved in cell wall biosynthesis
LFALEVSSGAGSPPYGGVGGAIRNLVEMLLRLDTDTDYALCYRYSRWRRGDFFAPDVPNARLRMILDPWNGLLLQGAELFHSMGVFLPLTPLRIPKLVTIHDLNPIRNPQWVTQRWRKKRSAKIRKAVSRADHVVTYSEFTAREIREELGVEAGRVHAVSLGVDTRKFRPLPTEEVVEIHERYGDYVLSIGLLTPRKNFERLVEAVTLLPNLRLVVVGRPSNGAESFWRAVERAGLGGRLVHLEAISTEELVLLLNGASVFAAPSLYEGFGLTVLEAMACGAPVVCSRAASLPEVAGDAALMVDASDAKALAEALDRVVNDRDLAASLRERGLGRAREFTWGRAAGRLRALYRDIAPG